MCEARASFLGSAWERTAHRTSGEGTSKQTQPETNRRVGFHAAAAIGLVAISSLFLHQKSDRAMAAEPVVKAPAHRAGKIGTDLGSAATETQTWPYTPASEAIGAVTRRFSLAAGGHEFEWSPEKYWSLGGAQPQFQERSVEVTPIAEAGESSLADRLSGYERFNVNQTITSGQFQSTTSQWPQLLTSTVVLSDGTISVPFMVAQPVGSNVPGLIPEMTSVHPVYVDGLRAEIQGLREQHHALERSRDLPDLETPRVVPIGLGSEQIREVHPSLTRNRHRVRAGDTLEEISRQYDVSIPELMQANQLADEDLIKVNQLLTIPPKRPTTSLGFASAESSTFNNAPGVWSKPVDSSRAFPVVGSPQTPLFKGGSAPTTFDRTHAPETVEPNPFIRRLLLEHPEIRLRMQQKQATSGDNSRDNNEALWPARQLEQSQAAPSAGMEMTGENTNKPGAVAPILPRLAAYIWPAKGTLTSRYVWRWGTPILSGSPEVVDFAGWNFGGVDFAGWNFGGYVNLVEIPQKQATSGDNLRENEPEAGAAAPIRNDQSVSPSPGGDSSEETAPFNGYIWPAKGILTSHYGRRWGRLHKGIDIAGPIGTPIFSAGPGVVDFAGWNLGGYGNLVEIRHPDGSLTRYAHNNRILVNKGQQVKQGQQIAEMGSTGYSTGPHLHFEVHPSGKGADNPISYLPPRK